MYWGGNNWGQTTFILVFGLCLCLLGKGAAGSSWHSVAPEQSHKTWSVPYCFWSVPYCLLIVWIGDTGDQAVLIVTVLGNRTVKMRDCKIRPPCLF